MQRPSPRTFQNTLSPIKCQEYFSQGHVWAGKGDIRNTHACLEFGGDLRLSAGLDRSFSLASEVRRSFKLVTRVFNF